ncbi:MAG TPA: hypothetical protein VFI57_07255 [Pyrinomonadaceae bacterium]|nr:hypothetical protein [Pyrinomonadaceae bacterium]
MSKKFLAFCLSLVAVSTVLGQSRSRPAKQSRPVKQTREVIQAYRVCSEFQHLLADNLDFDRSFEATFTKDPKRRRELAIAESEFGDVDLSQVDDATLIGIYKNQTQILLLMLPLMYSDEDKAVLFPPPVDGIFDRLKATREAKDVQAYAAQLNRDVAEFRAHVERLAASNRSVAAGIRQFKEHLLKPLQPPNRVVKPMTAYSKGRVLPVDAEYYQIEDYAVIREAGQMRIVGAVFFRVRF